MKVMLLRDQKIRHSAGEIVDVSPVEFNFLISINSAIPVSAEPKTEPKKRKAAK